MLKTILKIVLIVLVTFGMSRLADAQETDRDLEKDIKTEINLNRIAKSQERLQLSTYHKKAADAINLIALNSYYDNLVENSIGIQEDWNKIWEPVDKEFQKYFAHYNVVVIRESDYKDELRKTMYDKAAYYYKAENYEMSLSAIRYKNKIFLTILTW